MQARHIIKLTARLAIAIALLCIPQLAGAWGKKGHQIIAQLAFDMLSPRTQHIVKGHLGSYTISSAATWMDDIRKDPKYDSMKPWHYIHMERGQGYHTGGAPNIIDELHDAILLLAYHEALPAAQVQRNLLILIHLTGDIGQPLHVGYGADDGGSGVAVLFKGARTDLHKLWDEGIIDSRRITAQDCKDLLATMTDEQIAALKVTDPLLWMRHTRKLLPRVYDYTSGNIDDAYITRNEKVVKKQLLISAIRLAAALEELFGTPDNVATHPHTSDTVVLVHSRYTSHFVNSVHIPWVVEYALRAEDVTCPNPIKRSDRFAPDPLAPEATDINIDYKGSGYDRGHNMPAADNQCHGDTAMAECFYFSNMFPQTHRLNAGVWKTLEEQERTMAQADGMIYVWIGSYGVDTTIGPHHVVVPQYCWKVIYDPRQRSWYAYMFPNTTTVTGKPAQFTTTVADIAEKTGYRFRMPVGQATGSGRGK
ncbi:MAG: S1/P1 nuclease [Bacteroidota bacterium]